MDLETLRQVALFSACSNKELEKVAKASDEISMTAGTMVMDQGQMGREAFVVVEGEVTVKRNNRKVATLGPGDVVGEMSLVTDLPRNASVRADTFVNALVMSRAEFTKIMDENPKVAVKVLQTVATRLAENTRAV